MADPRLVEILRILDAQGVEFIVVGGMAAVIGGAPIVTRDVDVLVARSSANTPRVLAALSELDAIFRDDERRLRPNASHWRRPGTFCSRRATGHSIFLAGSRRTPPTTTCSMKAIPWISVDSASACSPWNACWWSSESLGARKTC